MLIGQSPEPIQVSRGWRKHARCTQHRLGDYGGDFACVQRRLAFAPIDTPTQIDRTEKLLFLLREELRLKNPQRVVYSDERVFRQPQHTISKSFER